MLTINKDDIPYDIAMAAEAGREAGEELKANARPGFFDFMNSQNELNF